MFILRTLFWLAVLILVLPTGKSAGTDTVTPTAAQANFDAGSALDAAIACEAGQLETIAREAQHVWSTVTS